jgi:hypothetical protein
MSGPWYVAPLRRVLVLALVSLAVGGGAGCDFPGTSAPTATAQPTATGVPATVAATATAPQVAVATPSIVPSPPTASATVAPTATATATVSPTKTIAPTMQSATPGTPGTPVQGGATPGLSPLGEVRVVREARQACELDIPASFVAAGVPDTFASADGRVTIALQSLDIGPDEAFDDLALPFVGNFIATVGGYQQTSVIRLADNLRIDFTGNRPGPGRGTLYFHQFGVTMCVVTLFVGDSANVAYDAFAEALIAGLRPKGVG